jgi:hypothetical protein
MQNRRFVDRVEAKARPAMVTTRSSAAYSKAAVVCRSLATAERLAEGLRNGDVRRGSA